MQFVHTAYNMYLQLIVSIFLNSFFLNELFIQRYFLKIIIFCSNFLEKDYFDEIFVFMFYFTL